MAESEKPAGMIWVLVQKDPHPPEWPVDPDSYERGDGGEEATEWLEQR